MILDDLFKLPALVDFFIPVRLENGFGLEIFFFF